MNSIAVCISGQIRNDDAALKKNMEHLSQIDADVFISVWKKRGTKTFGGASGPGHVARIFGHEIAMALPPNWFGRMRDVFPNSASIFPSLGDITTETLLRYFPKAILDIESENIDFSFNHSDSNSLRMLYKIWRCNGLKRKAEKDRRKRYDKVIRMRPDISLDFASIEKAVTGENELIVHGNKSGVENYMQDIYWFGNSDVDNRMAKAVAHAITCQDSGWQGIHHELYNHSVRSGLEIVQGNFITGNINFFANSNPEFDKQIQENFVLAVKQRKMDVDFAGGEDFCSIADQVLTAAHGRVRGNSTQVDEDQLIRQVSKIATTSPRLANMVLLLGASYFVGQKDTKFQTRFDFLFFYLKICAGNKLGPMIEKTLAAATDMFDGLQLDILRSLVTMKAIGDQSGGKVSPIPIAWSQIAFAKDGGEIELRVEEKVYSQIMKNDMFCNWVLQGSKIVKNEELIIDFARSREKYGKINLQTCLIAAKACKSIEDLELEKIFLTNANSIGENWFISGRLADISLSENRLEDAKAYIKKAMSFPDRQNWVVKLNDRIMSAEI